MNDIARMKSVEPVIYGVLKIQWQDGFVGLVDLRPVVDTGEMFRFLRDDKSRFFSVAMETYGHKVFWLDDERDEIDFGSQSLRERAERQAEILRLAS